MTFSAKHFTKILVVLSWTLAFLFVSDGQIAFGKEKTCIFLSSYSRAYLIVNNDVEDTVESRLKNHCKVLKFYMDTKKNNNKEYIKNIAVKAKEFIEANKPDIVITANENALAEVLVPYFKDSTIPFVFASVLWGIERHGLPFKNTTGVINVGGINQIAQELVNSVKGISTATFLADKTESSDINFKQQSKICAKYGIELKPALVKTVEEWKEEFIKAQTTTGAVFYGGFQSLKGGPWDKKEIIEFISKNIKVHAVSSSANSFPFSTFGWIRYFSEQGELASDAAIKILNGAAPNSIAVTTNKKFDPYVNTNMIGRVKDKLSASFLKKAKATTEVKE